ncbi:type VI secretion system tube protein Hcp [Mitsuaria sp. CC2]|uniref:type VI secretion system tube protein Hcp n=1 Tax=Mitsuaria sp. CC2 TaxID=3029186 RepID=UPI003B8BF628
MTQRARLYMSAVGDGGPIAGESRVPAMKDWIELDDWQWALDADGAAGRQPEPSVLSFTKRMDRASAALLSAMDRGMPMTVTLCMEDAAQELLSLSIKLRQARVTRYALELRDEDAAVSLVESWELDYREAEFLYREDRRSGVTTTTVTRMAGASTASPAAQESTAAAGAATGAEAARHGGASSPAAGGAAASDPSRPSREFALRDLETVWSDMLANRAPAGPQGLQR